MRGFSKLYLSRLRIQGVITNETFLGGVRIKPIKIFDKLVEFKPLIPRLKFIRVSGAFILEEKL